ncbi:transporter substrate-binding domain-containing protein [Aliikangiella coralliicola]|uniref:Transporter substrate-binding domain-containing protein n=1 Tax=Aliikangiella coralliicola TaxID=2592383 RepID=A0A545U8Q7_9GAMM|nr:transporter substrate-binding domain-containing protein [Aliikangiella coralliicola]TQV85854.1 transporter substrate-binding domain-containing protein [Aliikangiella coralliicola]
MIRKTALAILFLFVLCSCDAENNSSPGEEAQQTATHANPNQVPTQGSDSIPDTISIPNTLRSWSEIRQSGIIRALKLQWEDEESLPRSGSTSLYHTELLSQFATENDLTIQWVKVPNLKQMFQALSAFEADIIPRHLTVTAERQKHMGFTHPLVQDKEVLISAKATENNLADRSIKVSVPSNTAYIESVKKHYPNWEITTLEQSLNSEEIADAIVRGEFEFSVLDGLSVNTLTRYRNDIVPVLELPGLKQLAWAVNRENQSLLDKLNQFIAEHHISQLIDQDRTHDLDRIKEKHLPLRVITRNSPETYFLWRGELMGFEYELIRAFAKRHKLRLEIIVAENYQQMVGLLNQGKADLIAAGLSRTDERKTDLTFSIRYNRVSEKLVAHKDGGTISNYEDLKGREISVRKTSAFWSTAQKLAQDYGVKVKAADEDMSTELLIGQVASKNIDLTIADSNLISIEESFRDNIVTPLTLKENVPYAYAVRKNNPKLLSALNEFVRKEYRGTFYNVVKNKYFSNKKRQKKHIEERITSTSTLSPFDAQVKNKSREYQFDWRLIVSQMYQESRFNPKARSAAGAQGLMQVLPRTAKEMGYFDLTNPDQSIAAGVQYLDWTRSRFSKNLPIEERVLFALAAYNAGYGHVKDAQRLAEKMNLRTDKWFNHVEKAMLLLQQPKYYKQARFGYCRGSEPVNYVRNIHQRYLSYIDIVQ